MVFAFYVHGCRFKFLNMQLLFCVSLFCVFPSVVMDVHSLEYEVLGLVRFERTLIDSLENYFKRQENNNVTFDSGITSFVKDLQLKNEDFSSKPSTQFENPLSRYHVTKRLVKDWSVLKDNLTCLGEGCPLLTGEDVFKAVFKREKRVLPTDHDLEVAALALLHIWDIYDLDLAEIAGGKIRDVQGDNLSADDIFFIASVARDAGKYYGAIKWFEYLLLLVKKDSESTNGLKLSFKMPSIYRKLAASYHDYGMTRKAIELLEEYREKDPENNAIASDLKYFKSFGKDKEISELKRFDDSKTEKNAENYRKLCQASLEVTNPSQPLSCYIQPIFGTYDVSKQEQLSLQPRITLIYDIISDNEANVLLKYAGKYWQAQQRSSRRNVKEKSKKSGWFCERRPETSFLDVLSDRIEAVTHLKVWHFHGIPSSECYQFLRNWIGGKNIVTQDYWNKEDAELRPDAVNRYVTIRLQLSGTMTGGATVFPKLGIHIPNIKNSAVMWWNLRDDGKPNPKTVHIDCPLIAGGNSMLSKTVFYRNQVNIRKSVRR